jgi:hypothetical protein
MGRMKGQIKDKGGPCKGVHGPSVLARDTG